MRKMVIATLIVGTALSGCAQKQFVKGQGMKPSETVSVVTSPAGALARTNFGNECRTPCYLPLLRKTGGEITLSMDGYRSERFVITSSVSDQKIAMRSADAAFEAIDPDPISIGLTAIAHALDGKGGIMELNQKNLIFDLVPLKDGEEDVLAEPEQAPRERIPIDISEPAS